MLALTSTPHASTKGSQNGQRGARHCLRPHEIGAQERRPASAKLALTFARPFGPAARHPSPSGSAGQSTWVLAEGGRWRSSCTRPGWRGRHSATTPHMGSAVRAEPWCASERRTLSRPPQRRQPRRRPARRAAVPVAKRVDPGDGITRRAGPSPAGLARPCCARLPARPGGSRERCGCASPHLYPGAPHGLTGAHEQEFNKDLLDFLTN